MDVIAKNEDTIFDDQELGERAEAADAYAGEDPQHFVDYVESCVEESKESTKELRRVQDECWKAYQNQIDYSNKEDWQSKLITDKPFTTVKGAVSIIRKAFQSPNYLTVKGVEAGDVDLTEAVKRGLEFWCNEQHANFPIMITDASEMSLVVGQSMEIIPRWEDGVGLIIDLIPPWQIHRDPDARPRDPWSGNYWVHEEWTDLWVLKEGEKNGIFINVEELREEGKGKTQEEDEKRKNMIWKRSKFRKGVLVKEFFGVILSPSGELLLPNSTLTIASNQVIRPPRPTPFVKMRWPGTSFSPFPHLLRYDGRGILEGVLSVWWVLCNLMNLHIDNLAWVINKIREIDPSLLLDPRDAGEVYPGKVLVKKAGAQGNVVTVVQENGNTVEVLPNVQHLNQEWENGSFVNQFVLGLPGSRAQITKGEVAIKTQQSLGVFDSIGADIESGAVNAVWAIIETVVLNWTEQSEPSISRVFGNEAKEVAMMFSRTPVSERKELLKANCDIRVSGISAQLQRSEMIDKLQLFSRMVESAAFGPYIKPYELLQRNAEALGEPSPPFIATPDEAKQIREALNNPKPPPGEEGEGAAGEGQIEEIVTEESDNLGKSSTKHETRTKGRLGIK